ncbi:Gfo/Idh/MocA family protein [Streptomyces litchfieldiae]|uniref:Gfo/Idh/MocA family oxidoreductase n=1 Tax=Streptomyces litchfieldiae TaxID=3075543 RepID=A0ABU2MYJ1_9ACTN|nr:Gfo/Idh/MocA family oxidoreductase [Streptomyces sp. DSM 44938]MDT0345878.1 Gfo/Idh/MocA family oxidoreductase [Streptomyces sp. DSM 44938]
MSAGSGPVGVGIVGAGVISGEYLRTLSSFPDIRVLAVGDLDTSRAAAAAREHGVPVAGDLATVLAVPEVEIVVNLTIPTAHAAVATAALRAGKHVYGEKPLTATTAEGEKLLAEAAERGLLVGSAPDTFLGAGLQSALRAVRAGRIGTPIAAATAVQSLGPESWHPDPAFFYQPGAGPLFDIGPYYLTALVALFGPVSRVAATVARGRARRTTGSGPKAGETFPVDVPTHVSALLEFASGPRANSVFSFDSALPRIQFEVIGSDGTLAVPDPNTFRGPLRLRGNGDQDWSELPVEGATAGRGLGVLEMARALRAGEPHRASGALGLHVLQTMAAIAESGERGEFRSPGVPTPGAAAVTAPEPLPLGWDPHVALLG